MRLSWDDAYKVALFNAITDQDAEMQRVYGEIALAIKAHRTEAKDMAEMLYWRRQMLLQRLH